MMNNRMSRMAFAAVAALAAGLGLGASAHAQDTQKVQKPFAIKIGYLAPSDGDTKNATGKSRLTLGLSYDFGKTKSANPIVYGGYFDYLAESSKSIKESFDDVDQYNNLVTFDLSAKNKSQGGGLGVSGRVLLAAPNAKSVVVPYIGGGLGIYHLQNTFSYKVTQTSGTPQGLNGSLSQTNNKTGLGGKVFAGLETKSGFLGEIEYQFLPKVSVDDPAGSGTIGELKPSGFGLRAGYRF